MSKLFSRVTLGILIVSLALMAFNGTVWAADKKYIIKMSSEYAPKHPTIVNGFTPYFEEIKKKTGGRLEIQYFAPNTLTPAREAYSATVHGVVDMAFSPQAFVSGKFPLSNVTGLPLMFQSAEAGSLTTWELYKRFPNWQAEYKEVKPLWHHVSALFELHTTKKHVKTIEELQGMKIIVWHPPTRKIVVALGANPVETTPQDTYLALERGMAEGVLCPIAPMRSFKISDTAKYHTMLNLSVLPFWGAMNQKKWNSLPPDLQKVLEDTMGEKMARIAGKTLDDGAARDITWMKEHGHTYYTLPPQERKRWLAKVEGIHGKWINDMQAKGHKNAQEIYDTTVRLSAQFQEQVGK
jgi:TRAP-type C4-dicarboxylate transport system substrate-binding protein